MFPVTEQYSIQQLELIKQILRDNRVVNNIVYQSNWLLTIAFLDNVDAMFAKQILREAVRWEIEIRPGKKTTRYFIQIKFKRD